MRFEGKTNERTNKQTQATANIIGQTKEALNTFKDLQRRQRREANKHASSVH